MEFDAMESRFLAVGPVPRFCFPSHVAVMYPRESSD